MNMNEFIETPPFLPFYINDPNHKALFNQTYLNHQIKEFNIFHKKDFNSKPFFQEKFGNAIVQTKDFKQILDNILTSLETISKTKVFENANIDLSIEKEEKMALNFYLSEKRKYDYKFDVGLLTKNEGNFGLCSDIELFCRTPFNRMDYHKLQIVKGMIIGNNPTFYRFVSCFPFVFDQKSFLKFKLTKKNKLIDKNIEEASLAQKIRVVQIDKNWKFDFKHKYLKNHYNVKLNSQYILDNQIFPSDEYSLKYKKRFINTVDYESITPVGKQYNGSFQVSFNDNYANYMKFKLNLLNFIRFTDPETQKNQKFLYMNLENRFDFGLYIPLKNTKQNLINNLYTMNNRVLGFRNIGDQYASLSQNTNQGDYKRSQLFLINSMKLNMHDYPIFNRVGIVPFLHLTSAFVAENSKDFFRNKRDLFNCFRSSIGIGVKIPLGKKNLLASYNFLHLERKNDVAAKFQIVLL